MSFLKQTSPICTYIQTKTACDLMLWLKSNTCAVLLENLENYSPTEAIQVFRPMRQLVYIHLAKYENLQSAFGLNPYRVSWCRQTSLTPIHANSFKKKALELCGFPLHNYGLRSQAI